MKIVVLGSAHPLRGGLATFNERLARALTEQGHEVEIVSFSLQYPSVLFPGKSQYTDEPVPAGLYIHTLVNSVNPFNWIKVGRWLKRSRPDVVIVKFWLPFMGPSLGTILRLVKKNRHTRVISILDNVIPHEKRPGDRLFTRYFFKPVDAFLAMSREVLQDLRTFTDKPAIYTPHPLYDNYGALMSRDEAIRTLGLDLTKKYLLFFGFIRKYKGLDWLLQAMNDPRIRTLDLQLIVAGEFYGDEAYYKELIEKWHLQDNIHLFTSFIPNDEVRIYFSAADVVVQPYKTATQSGITQIAYHFEKPMIVTRVGGLAENIPDGKVGLVADPDPESIAEKIVLFYETEVLPDFRSDIRREKTRYSWEHFVQQLLSLYTTQ